MNLFCNWLRPFLSNSWSVLDAFIVTMSLVVLGPLDFSVSILRALRAMRVVRLFGRLESSKKIFAALSVSLIPMCNAFLVNLIVAMICAPPTPHPLTGFISCSFIPAPLLSIHCILRSARPLPSHRPSLHPSLENSDHPSRAMPRGTSFVLLLSVLMLAHMGLGSG